MKHIIKQFLLLSFLLLFVLFPQITIEGAGNGLLLWYQTIIPALLPFLMMTQLFLYSGSYIMILAFFCGYPTAARLANERLTCGIISSFKARFYLYLCNNASIAFLTGYVCHGILGNTVPIWKFLFWIYTPVFTFGILYYSIFISRERHSSTAKQAIASYSSTMKHPAADSSAMPTLDESMTNAFSIIMKIGGYIMLFSIAANFISLFPLSSHWKAMILGVLEITNGLQAISGLSMDPIKKTALIAAMCSFGGLCSAAQTKSVLTQSKLSITRYLLVKIFCSICTYQLVIFTY